MDDPHWNRDGLTEWDFDALPAEIDLPSGRLTVKAYPALVDCGGSVSLRLVDSQQRAELETHYGLRRLCFLAARRELKTQVDWLPNLEKMEVYAATLPGFDLRGQLAELLADRAMLIDQPAPRTKDEFESLLSAGRERIAWAMQELAALARPLFEGYHQACLAIEGFCSQEPKTPLAASQQSPRAKNFQKETVPRWQYAIDDMREQIAYLMHAQSFSKTPWEWLRQYLRYFRAIGCRLENLPGGVPRDFQKYEDFQPHWKLYLEHARHQQSLGIVDPELLHFRWMLEEFRVSLFAQKLGTAIPVSPKRLEQQWAKSV